MSILAEPVLHDIKRSADWPHPISNISDQLFRPLPNHVQSKAHERRQFLSLGSWELYQNALSSPLFAVRDEDAQEPSTISVTDVMDSILSCVSMVKAASSFGQGHKQAQLSWISVITQLGIGMSEDIISLEDATFLRARTKQKSVVTDVKDVLGRSSLLLATLLSPPFDTSDASDTDMKIDETEPNVPSCDDFTASESTIDVLDIPFDAHVLPGRGRRVHCLLPVVCVAPEHEIQALVTSVVCQRHVLNITHPVVGISLSCCGTRAKVVLGWAKEQNPDDEYDSLPTIRMAFAQGSDIHPSIGVFDLLDPASMLYFAQFILWLQPYFSSVNECDTFRMRKFCWRLDHIGCDDSTRCPDSSNDLSWTEVWIRAQSTEIAETTSTSNPPSTDVMPQSKGSSSQKKPFLEPPSDSRRSARLRRTTPQQTGAPAGSSSSNSSPSDNIKDDPDYSPSPSPPQSQSAADAPTASYYPASDFAKFSDETGKMDKWLFERQTMRLFRLKVFGASSDLEIQINDMVQRYNEMTQFSWPKSWSDQSEVPSRDAVHENTRKRLFESYKEYKNKLSDMEEDVFLSINNHLSSLYKAVTTAKASELQAKVGEGKEAFLRSSWDELLKAVCCDVNDAVSKFVIVEKSVPLPRNKATELGPTFGAESQFEVLQLLLSKQMPTAQARPVPPAISRCIALSFLRTQSLKPPTDLKPKDREWEPLTAKADAICYLQHDMHNTPTQNDQDSQSGTGSRTEETKKKKGWMSRFIKTVSPNPSKACVGHTPDKLLPPPKDEILDRHVTCHTCSFVTERLCLPSPPKVTEHLDLPSPPEPPVSEVDSDTEMHIPYLFAEYKKDGDGEHQAFHQAQMYVTFGLQFLAILGIKNEPVWALVTSGTVGTIVMAWKSTAKSSEDSAVVEYNFIIDQYLRSFDISEPLEALQLMACLRRIYVSGLGVQDTVASRMKGSMFTNASASATSKIQTSMMPPRPKAKTQATHVNECTCGLATSKTSKAKTQATQAQTQT